MTLNAIRTRVLEDIDEHRQRGVVNCSAIARTYRIARRTVSRWSDARDRHGMVRAFGKRAPKREYVMCDAHVELLVDLVLRKPQLYLDELAYVLDLSGRPGADENESHPQHHRSACTRARCGSASHFSAANAALLRASKLVLNRGRGVEEHT